MRECRAHVRILRIGICCWSEQKRSAPGTATAGCDDRQENMLHVHYNVRYSCALWQGQHNCDHCQPHDHLQEPGDQIRWVRAGLTSSKERNPLLTGRISPWALWTAWRKTKQLHCSSDGPIPGKHCSVWSQRNNERPPIQPAAGSNIKAQVFVLDIWNCFLAS